MDAFGQAALDFLKAKHDEFIYVESETMEDDVIPVNHLFRNFEEMPTCEQIILHKATGNTLDVGGGVGSHCLYLQEQGLQTTMLDLSSGLCEVSKERGIKNVVNHDFFSWKTKRKYDTLLFMMNGIGIGGTFEKFHQTIERSFELLKDGGQVLFDSTDITFCYAQEDGSFLLPMNTEYIGFVKFKLTYKNKEDNWFNWAYYDSEKLRELLPKKYSLEILKEDGPAYCGRITLL